MPIEMTGHLIILLIAIAIIAVLALDLVYNYFVGKTMGKALAFIIGNTLGNLIGNAFNFVTETVLPRV